MIISLDSSLHLQVAEHTTCGSFFFLGENVEAEGRRGRESMASDTQQSPWKTGLGVRSDASATATTPPNRKRSPQFPP